MREEKFYHLLIEIPNTSKESDEKIKHPLYDQKNLDEKIEPIILSYLKGNNFNINGHIIDSNSITRFLIKESKENIEIYKKKKNDSVQKYSSEYYYKEDILELDEFTKDITDKVLENVREKYKIKTKNNNNGIVKTMNEGDSKKFFCRTIPFWSFILSIIIGAFYLGSYIGNTKDISDKNELFKKNEFNEKNIIQLKEEIIEKDSTINLLKNKNEILEDSLNEQNKLIIYLYDRNNKK